MTIHGGCLCQKVQYKITGPLLAADHCHCSMCRRQHGAAFATYANFNPGEFKWECGAALVKIYEPDNKGGWCFCSACGSTLAGTSQGTVTSITLATVKGDPGIQPQSHIFVGSKACWYKITDSLAQFDKGSNDN